MENNHLEPSPQSSSPFLSILIIFFLTIIGMFVGNFFGLLAVIPFFDLDINATLAFLGDPTTTDSGKTPLLIVQGVTSIFTFVLAPMAYVKYYENNDYSRYFKIADPLIPAVLLTLLLGQTFMFLNTPVIEWNMNLKLPGFLSEFEAFAQEQELYLQRITEYLTFFDSTSQFVLAIFVMAIIPGVAEEFLFRGLIQRKLTGLFGNAHMAIWIGAFIFGLFHLQFYGIIPRMLLGALFGYLYWWSGSLLLAIIAHFFNNAFTLVMVYLYQQGQVNFDIEGTSEIPISTVIISGAMFGLVVYYFVKIVKRKTIKE